MAVEISVLKLDDHFLSPFALLHIEFSFLVLPVFSFGEAFADDYPKLVNRSDTKIGIGGLNLFLILHFSMRSC